MMYVVTRTTIREDVDVVIKNIVQVKHREFVNVLRDSIEWLENHPDARICLPNNYNGEIFEFYDNFTAFCVREGK